MTIKQWRDYLAEFSQDDFGLNKTTEAILADWEAASLLSAPAAGDRYRERIASISSLVGEWKMALSANPVEAKRRGLSMRGMIVALERLLSEPGEVEHG